MSMRCPKCGTMYPDESRFCTKDGGRLVAFTPGGPSAFAPSRAAIAESHRTTPRGIIPDLSQVRALNHANMSGQVLDGRYAIAKKIGEGGMSFVYLAQDVATNTSYAIKILSPALSRDENAMARLRREAALGIRLAHPNVCHIVRMGETEDGLVYVVMPYVEGEVLADFIYSNGPVPLPTAVKFMCEIAAGLHIAHQLKIIHRDLKPENVMLAKSADGTKYAVVMDFGLAKERRVGGELEKLTATGIILGTPEFMSPEQLRGKPLDGRTDIYSLSLMTYEMLTGKLPFDGRTQQEMMIARLRNEPIPLRQRQPGLDFPEAVERVLAKAMARIPDERYTTTPEFAEEMRKAARGSGGAAPGVLGRIFKR
jgi:eukaryotic-like serine/threonine-protein kinase